jgi:hypothetical protein
MPRYYLTFWPALASATVLAISGATSLVHRHRYWLAISVACATLALFFYAPALMRIAADPINNILHRDIVAALLIVGLTPLLVGWLVYALSRYGYSPVRRAVSAIVFGLLCALAAPWVVLFVHCTSGDCL